MVIMVDTKVEVEAREAKAEAEVDIKVVEDTSTTSTVGTVDTVDITIMSGRRGEGWSGGGPAKAGGLAKARVCQGTQKI